MLEGFGSETAGGTYGQTIVVSSLADSGPGTLRAALQGDKRRIVFEVAGMIELASQLEMRGQREVTIDGSTAPGAGITLQNYGITIRGGRDIIVQHLRIRNVAGDNLLVWRDSAAVVIDHCSLTNTGDECLNITENTRDVTVSYCLLADTRAQGGDLRSKGCLITNWDRPPVTRVSMHHNLFHNFHDRSPQISTAGLHDVRCNVIHDWASYGMRWRGDAFGNVINNVFAGHEKPWDALILDPDAGRVYVHGNLGPDGEDLDARSTREGAYAVAPVLTEPVAAVERCVHAQCGAQPRDAIDAAIVQASAFGWRCL